MSVLKPCPFCGTKNPQMKTSYDTDGSDAIWKYVECFKCGARTRGKWFTPGNDCPQFYAEVREYWNSRNDSPEGEVK